MLHFSEFDRRNPDVPQERALSLVEKVRERKTIRSNVCGPDQIQSSFIKWREH